MVIFILYVKHKSIYIFFKTSPSFLMIFYAIRKHVLSPYWKRDTITYKTWYYNIASVHYIYLWMITSANWLKRITNITFNFMLAIYVLVTLFILFMLSLKERFSRSQQSICMSIVRNSFGAILDIFRQRDFISIHILEKFRIVDVMLGNSSFHHNSCHIRK